MKIKGIPFWEQYIEHMVLGLAVLVLIAFAAMQFVGDPNSVDVPGVGKVGPSKIDELLEQRAASIAQQISGGAIDIPQPPTLADAFETARVAGVSPSETLPMVAYALSPSGKYAVPIGERPFVIPTVPAPTDVIAQQYFDTLSQEVVAEHPDLATSLPASAPYDITWITPAAKFDAAAVRRQFSQAGPDGEAPLPLRWYENRIEYIDLKIEREELVNGEWVSSLLLEPIPGQVTVRPKLLSKIDSATRDEILATVYDPAAVVQPEFYTGVSAAWVPPFERQAAALDANATEEEIEIAEWRMKLETARKELDRILGLMKEKNCPENAPGAPSPKPGGQGGDSRGGTQAPGAGGAVGSSSGARDQSTTGKPANEAECRRLRSKRDVLLKQVATAEAGLAKFTNITDPEPKAVEQEVVDLATQDEILVWGHDINVEPGKTYRYRFTIEIYNPLFARRNELIPAQQEMAEKFTLASAASEWSQPIYADPPLRIFTTEARPAGQPSGVGQSTLGTITAEVYRFRDGRWWEARFTVQPGERIGGTRLLGRRGDPAAEQIDYGTDWFLLDIVPDVAPEDGDSRASRAATILLQSLSDASAIQYRSPRDDIASPDRAFLRQEVRAAGTGEPVASR